jgi:hypothetical protein
MDGRGAPERGVGVGLPCRHGGIKILRDLPFSRIQPLKSADK